MKHLRKLTITGAAVAAFAASTLVFRRRLPESLADLHREARGRHYWLFRDLGAKASIDWDDPLSGDQATVWKVFWPNDPDMVYRLVMVTDAVGRTTTATECEALTVALRNQTTWRELHHIFSDVGYQIRLNQEAVAGVATLDIWWPERPDEVWRIQFWTASATGERHWRSDDPMVTATIEERLESGLVLSATQVPADQAVRL